MLKDTHNQTIDNGNPSRINWKRLLLVSLTAVASSALVAKGLGYEFLTDKNEISPKDVLNMPDTAVKAAGIAAAKAAADDSKKADDTKAAERKIHPSKIIKVDGEWVYKGTFNNKLRFEL